LKTNFGKMAHDLYARAAWLMLYSSVRTR
jgi:hypothetical protein